MAIRMYLAFAGGYLTLSRRRSLRGNAVAGERVAAATRGQPYLETAFIGTGRGDDQKERLGVLRRQRPPALAGNYAAAVRDVNAALLEKQ